MKRIVIFFLCALVVICVVFAVLLLPKHQTATIDGHVFFVDVASSQSEQETGLAKYTSLSQNRAMYFPFAKPDYYTFWMKGMHFPIDMLFLNNGKIITIFSDVPVKGDYKDFTYTPLQPANGVLEINAGLAKKYGFKIGDRVEIKI